MAKRSSKSFAAEKALNDFLQFLDVRIEVTTEDSVTKIDWNPSTRKKKPGPKKKTASKKKVAKKVVKTDTKPKPVKKVAKKKAVKKRQTKKAATKK